MTYAGIDKKRFIQLLDWGTDDDELRRFFVDSRLQLIQKGAKVQNLPHGKPARVRMLASGLPSSADRLVQKWFAEHLTMVDPELPTEVINTLRMYEEAGENPADDEGKRLARSCLVHLFAEQPAVELMTFLKASQGGATAEASEPKDVTPGATNGPNTVPLSKALAATLVALAEGRDPDEHLSSLAPTIASFVAGLHAVKSGRDDEVQGALGALEVEPDVRDMLADYAAKMADARARASHTPLGLQLIQLVESEDELRFDFDRDEVIGICTRDIPESTFIQPFAIRSASGTWVSLARVGQREQLFHSSGDLIAFVSGRDIPKQPKRGEIGVWRVAENRVTGPSHRTNFHIASDKTMVYEVRNVPFASTEYDSVREYIKHQIEVGGPSLAKTSLFMLRDEWIVGCPPSRDLAKDEGFEVGLPCWRALPAIRFEGRILVPGPLPPSETYECETLGSSLRKLVASDKSGSDKPTKAQVRKLQELLASGELHLNAARIARLRAELGFIEEHEGAMAVLLDEVMQNPRITARVDELVTSQVDALVGKKEQLRKDIAQLERQYADAVEERRKTEKEQKAMAPAVSKAIRGAFDKARGDALGTLGQVAVFKALIDELVDRTNVPPSPAPALGPAPAITARAPAANGLPVVDTLRLLGVTPKCARAIELVGTLAHECGLILILEGVAARIAADAWMDKAAADSQVLECGIGVADDSLVKAVLATTPDVIVILDANLSPLDVYARPLIDMVQRRMSTAGGSGIRTKILMSVADGIAALPVPAVVESVALRASLDRIPMFLQESEVAARLEELASSDPPIGWFASIWKPAAGRLLHQLRAMHPEEAALALSLLEAGQVES